MDSIPRLKRCTKCNVEKHLDHFVKAKGYRDGYTTWCKLCRNAHERTKYHTDPEAARARDREKHNRYRQANPDHYRNRLNEWRNRQYRENEEYRENEKRRGRENSKKLTETGARRKASYPGKYRKQWMAIRNDPTRLARRNEQKRIRATDPTAHEKAKTQSRATYRRNPQPYIKRARERAQTLKLIGSYTQAEWEALCAYYDHRCLCCGEVKPLTRDHVIPISKGGDNTIHNIQPLCDFCNKSKQDKTADYRAIVQSRMEWG